MQGTYGINNVKQKEMCVTKFDVISSKIHEN